MANTQFALIGHSHQMIKYASCDSFFRSIFLAIAFLVIVPAHALEFEIDMSSSRLGSGFASYDILAKGVIERNDQKKLLNIFHAQGELPHIFRIDSNGGDVVEAIEIGRLLRKGLVSTQAWRECASACFLIVVSGVTRQTLTAGVGLHRPKYDESYFAKLSASQAQMKYAELDKYVRQYLVNMNVPTQIIDHIMSISSGDVRRLSKKQFEKDIGIWAPGYQEWLWAKCDHFSPEEEADFDGIQLSAVPAELAYVGAHTETEIAEVTSKLERTKQFSDGYTNYLKVKTRSIVDCRKPAIRSERQRVFAEIEKGVWK